MHMTYVKSYRNESDKKKVTKDRIFALNSEWTWLYL